MLVIAKMKANQQLLGKIADFLTLNQKQTASNLTKDLLLGPRLLLTAQPADMKYTTENGSCLECPGGILLPCCSVE